MFDERRRKVLALLNSRYIYGKVPLLHAIVFLVEMMVVSRLVAKFNSYYADKPVLTMMLTNSVLNGIADTVAQSLTAFRHRPLRKSGAKDEFLSIEIRELDRKGAEIEEDFVPNRSLPPPFDFERLTRFMAYGFILAPFQFKWFQFLSKTFPITKSSGTVPALKRVAFDQFIFAPISIGFFFTFMTIAEGGGKRAVARKFQDVYLPTLKANFVLWPAVQILNFRVIPIQFQLPFVSTIGIAWSAYLSLSNQAEEI